MWLTLSPTSGIKAFFSHANFEDLTLYTITTPLPYSQLFQGIETCPQTLPSKPRLQSSLKLLYDNFSLLVMKFSNLLFLVSPAIALQNYTMPDMPISASPILEALPKYNFPSEHMTWDQLTNAQEERIKEHGCSTRLMTASSP